MSCSEEALCVELCVDLYFELFFLSESGQLFGCRYTSESSVSLNRSPGQPSSYRSDDELVAVLDSLRGACVDGFVEHFFFLRMQSGTFSFLTLLLFPLCFHQGFQ